MRYLHSRQVEFGGLESTLDRVDARILHRCHQPRTLLRRDGEVGAECGCVNNRRARACRVGCYGRSGACTGLQAAPVGTREPAGGGCSGAVEGWGGAPPEHARSRDAPQVRGTHVRAPARGEAHGKRVARQPPGTHVARALQRAGCCARPPPPASTLSTPLHPRLPWFLAD